MTMTLKRRTPTACPQVFAPVMADDGHTYANQCLAQTQGHAVVRVLARPEITVLQNQQRWALGESLPLDAPGRSSAEKIALIVGFTGLALSAIGLGVGYWARHRKQKATGLGYAKGTGERPLLKSGVVEHYDARMPIQMRVSLLQQLVYKSVHDPVMGPKLKKLALEITAGCPPNDPVCKTKAIYLYVKKAIRYTGDLAPIERSDGRYEAIDLFQSALKTLQYGGGDCDDHSGLNAVLLYFNDLPGEFKITAPTLSSDWQHVYEITKSKGQVIALDTTLPGYRWGFEAPNGRHVEYPSYVAAKS